MTDAPVSKSSPYYAWDRDSPGWLHRCVAENDVILPIDVARVVEKNLDLVSDDVVRTLVLRGLRGELLGKRGRKALTAEKIWTMGMRYEELCMQAVASGRPARRGGVAPAARGPSRMGWVHDQLAKEFNLGGGQNVRNLISRIRTGKNVRVKRSRP